MKIKIKRDVNGRFTGEHRVMAPRSARIVSFKIGKGERGCAVVEFEDKDEERVERTLIFCLSGLKCGSSREDLVPIARCNYHEGVMRIYEERESVFLAVVPNHWGKGPTIKLAFNELKKHASGVRQSDVGFYRVPDDYWINELGHAYGSAYAIHVSGPNYIER